MANSLLEIGFSNHSIQKKFEKALLKIPHKNTQERIMLAVESLADNPRPFGTKPFKQLKPPLEIQELTATFRLRIGDYRVVYDVDDQRKIVWLIALRKRGGRPYK